MRRTKSWKRSKKRSAKQKLFRGSHETPAPKAAASRTWSQKQLRSVGVENEAAARNLIDRFDKVLSGPAATPRRTLPDHIVMGTMKDANGVERPVPQSMVDLIAHAASPKFRESWRIVCWMHLKHKAKEYAAAHLKALEEQQQVQDKLAQRMVDLSIPSSEKWRVMNDSEELASATDVANHFKRLATHCLEKSRNLENNQPNVETLLTGSVPVTERVREFREVLSAFALKTTQYEVSDYVARLLLAFFQNPLFARNQFFSFTFVGEPGTGKTTIARDLAKVLVTSGLFEGGFYDKSKADFIGQYLGQTPHITRRALTTYALEGVLFIDETYSLCNLDDKGNVDTYGGEFAATLIDFMTRFKGLSCIITAGYEKEMRQQFFAANDGLPRRFPHRFLLLDLDTQQLTGIVRNDVKKVLRPTSLSDTLDDAASRLIEDTIAKIRTHKARLPRLYKVIENQAGSAANIAEFLMMHMEGRQRQRYFKAREGLLSDDLVFSTIEAKADKCTPQDIVQTLQLLLSQTAMSEKEAALRELAELQTL